MLSIPPANPMSIELTVTHRRAWWQADDEHRPEPWEVSADVSGLDACPPAVRHVAALSVAVADLRRGQVALDAMVLGGWAPDFMAAVAAGDGRLHPDLEDRVGDGPPRVVIVRRYELAPEWRGFGLGPVLLSGALAAFLPLARLAAFRVSPPPSRPGQPHEGGPTGGPARSSGHGAAGRTHRERAAERVHARQTAVLDRLGFWLWHEVHVADLRSPELAAARQGPPERWVHLDWR